MTQRIKLPQRHITVRMAWREMVVHPDRISRVIQIGGGDVLDILGRLLRRHGGDHYYAYERKDRWHVGLGVESALSIAPDGRSCTLTTAEGEKHSSPSGNLAQAAREFSLSHTSTDQRIYGHIGFNYAACIHGQPYTPGHWPLVSLVIPRVEVVIRAGAVEVIARTELERDEIAKTLVDEMADASLQLCFVDADDPEGAYQNVVRQALREIEGSVYRKVIASRQVTVEHRIDMISSLILGRRSNTPARTFAFRNGAYEAIGFSPELVMQVEDGIVSTEPLAGTRSIRMDPFEDEKNRAELISDGKEIIEHVLSVRSAIEELEKLCHCETVAVHDFMSVRRRGSVQHLGSRVSGKLRPDRDAWDALNVLFPSITASGIPKLAAIAAIGRLECIPRELYSGAVIMIEGSTMFEATLALRSAFQDNRRSWVQAGAGIIAQSDPDREFIETAEKLASVIPYLVAVES